MTLSRILALLVLSFSLPAHSLTNECGDFTSIDGTGYLVAPSGKDDTANIECAFESATSQGLTSVKLEKGTFKVSSLVIEGFEGKFEGTNRSETQILLANNTLSCGDELLGSPALITFVGGNVSVNKMTLDVDRPCERGDSFSVLEFTQQSCSARTHFANVDRVSFTGPDANSPDYSRAVAMVGKLACVEDGKGPLGTFKLNRSSIDGFDVGVMTSLLGAGQVDINFNEFFDVTEAILVENANQSTTITGNDVEYYIHGVVAYTNKDYAPDQNRVVVHNNKFRQQSTGTIALAVRVQTEEKRSSISTVISNNTFELIDRGVDDYIQAGVGIFDTDNAFVSNNRFEGSCTIGIYVDSFGFDIDAENTVITGNTFSQTNSYNSVDVYLGERTYKTIVGAQGAKTEDYGTQNKKL